MQGLGFTWRQTTAAKTEAGNRPIRVNEAHALAEIFGVTVNDLLPYETDQAHEERMAFSLLAAAKLRIEDSVLASHNADKQRDNALDLATDAQMLLQDAGVPPTEALNRMFRHEDDNDEGGKE